MSSAPDGPSGPSPAGGVSAPLALVFAVILFVAIVIGGLGITSLVTSADVVSTPGLGQYPGVLGVVVATAAFAGTLFASIRRPRPSFWTGVRTAVAAFLGYVLIVGGAVLIESTDIAVAAGVVGHLITGGFALVVAAAGLLAGWVGVVLVRTNGGRPRWPWEDHNTP